MYTVVDLFAGAGGLSLGFEQEGHFKIVGLVENNESALETYRRNHFNDLPRIDKDIRGIDLKKYSEKLGKVDVVIGGPPCQGFSNANRQKTKFISMNNALVKKYADVVLALSPRAFVMENVAMLKSPVHKFFDSYNDHDEVVGIGVEMKDEKYTIMNRNPDGFEIYDLLESKERVQFFSLDEKTYRNIKLIHRYENNPSGLKNYFSYYAGSIIKSLSEYIMKFLDDDIGNIIKGYINVIINVYKARELNANDADVIRNFIEFLTAINLMGELYSNNIIFGFLKDSGPKIEVAIKSYSVYDYLTKRLGKKYIIDSSILNARDYGAPQERKRFILMGINRDFKDYCKISFPKPIENVSTTVRDAIGDLEEYEPSTSVTDLPIKRQSMSANEFTLRLQDGAKEIYNHVAPQTRAIALERFRHIEQGKNFHSLSIELKNNYSDPSRTQNTVYLRLKYNDICGTVVNVRKSMWIHPVKDRAISIREAARLQTFPDTYIFCGGKDSQYQQVGNAVPPILSRAIANELYEMLENSGLITS